MKVMRWMALTPCWALTQRQGGWGISKGGWGGGICITSDESSQVNRVRVLSPSHVWHSSISKIGKYVWMDDFRRRGDPCKRLLSNQQNLQLFRDDISNNMLTRTGKASYSGILPIKTTCFATKLRTTYSVRRQRSEQGKLLSLEFECVGMTGVLIRRL